MSEVKKKQEVNVDLAKERAKCNFNIEEVTIILDGDENKTSQRRKIGTFDSNININYEWSS